jgi:hypothetical protein
MPVWLVLDAVKAWPASASERRTRGATASLDRVSARGQRQIMGRDEETGLSGRTKKQATSLGGVSKTLPFFLFLCSTSGRFFVPTCRCHDARAQTPSRLAVAQPAPHAPL